MAETRRILTYAYSGINSFAICTNLCIYTFPKAQLGGNNYNFVTLNYYGRLKLCGLFNDAVSSWVYIGQTGRTFSAK